MENSQSVDPDSQAVLDLIAASGRPLMEKGGVESARESMRASRLLLGATPSETQVRDIVAPRTEGEILIRLYRPPAKSAHCPLPLLVYFHGGGWVLGDIETGDAFCATLAQRVGIAVAAVDYRLAPEHPFPAAVEDAFAALDWLVANAQAVGVDTNFVAVCGDSAGGNLAAVCALRARDPDQTPLRAQILLYPVTDLAMATESYRRNAEGYGLTANAMRWFRELYLSGADDADWRASPLRADQIDNIAPALVVTCGFDPLCDEGAAYAHRLRAANVPVRHLHYPRQIHGFAMWGRAVRDAEAVLREVGDELMHHLRVSACRVG